MVPGLIQDHGGKKEEAAVTVSGDRSSTDGGIWGKRTKKLIRFLVLKSKHVNEIKDGCNDITLRGYLYVILGIVLDNVFLTETDSSFDAELSSALLIYLNQNFRKKITLNTLSNKFGYSKSYLSRFFKKNLGIGFNSYVNILRLRHYLLLMHEKKHTNTYCAFESGFDSMATFYRVFKQEFNCSPGEYFSKN